MAGMDKVEFEKLVDKYLEDEIPLSYLLEDYKLTYPQMKLLVNRALSYNRKVESLINSRPNASYNDVAQSNIAIPHEFQEEYPFSNEEQIALFKKLQELKETVPCVTKDMIRIIDKELEEIKASLEAFDVNDINKAEKIGQDILNMKANGDDFEDIFRRNFVTPRDFQRLNEIYASYLKLRDDYQVLINKRAETLEALNVAKRMNMEIEDIRTSLVVHNIKLVNYCVRYFFSGILLPQDEVQLYGFEGLVRAINYFNPELGYQFSTYAVPLINSTIRRYFKDMTGLTWRDFRRKEYIRYYRDWYRREIGENFLNVSARDLAESGLVTLTEKEIAYNDQMLDQVVSLSEVQVPFEDQAQYGLRNYPATFEDYRSVDSFVDANEDSTVTLEQEFASKYVNNMLLDVLKTLPVRQAQAIILYYGLEDGISRSLEEIGQIFNVSRERVRQLKSKGIRKLRHPSRAKYMRGLLDYLVEADTQTDISQTYYRGR